MERPDILAKLQTIFDDIFLEPPRVTPELSAADVAEWDSLIHISLIVAVEKAFGVRFRVGEVEATTNIADLVALIEKRAGER